MRRIIGLFATLLVIATIPPAEAAESGPAGVFWVRPADQFVDGHHRCQTCADARAWAREATSVAPKDRREADQAQTCRAAAYTCRAEEVAQSHLALPPTGFRWRPGPWLKAYPAMLLALDDAEAFCEGLDKDWPNRSMADLVQAGVVTSGSCDGTAEWVPLCNHYTFDSVDGAVSLYLLAQADMTADGFQDQLFSTVRYRDGRRGYGTGLALLSKTDSGPDPMRILNLRGIAQRLGVECAVKEGPPGH